MCCSTVGANIAKYRNTSKVLPLPKQNLLFTKLIRLYLRVHKIPQIRGVSVSLNNLPTRFLSGILITNKNVLIS